MGLIGNTKVCSVAVCLLACILQLLLCYKAASADGPDNVNCSSTKYIVCRAYTNQNQCDVGWNNTSVALQSSGIRSFQANMFMASNKKTGVTFNWKASHHLILNRTEGFLLKVSRNKTGVEVEEACIYMHIWSPDRIISERLIWYQHFRYTIPYLEKYNTVYTVKAYTLPRNPDVAPSIAQITTYRGPNSSTSTTKASTQAPDRFPINLTCDTEDPYRLRVSFIRTSYRPDSRVLYNHTYYTVTVTHREGGISETKYIDGRAIESRRVEKVESRRVEKSLTEEYAVVTFRDIIPGKYKVQVVPYKQDMSGCVSRRLCQEQADQAQIWYKDSVYITGTDYLPEVPPVLRITPDNNLTLFVPLAPDNHHIQKYTLVLQSHNTSANYTNTVPSSMFKESREWTEGSVSIRHMYIHDSGFKQGHSLYAEIIPVLVRSICASQGECNVDGRGCKACNHVLSNQVTLPGIIPERHNWELPVFLPIAIVVLVSIASFCLWRRRRPIKLKVVSLISPSTRTVAIPLRPMCSQERMRPPSLVEQGLRSIPNPQRVSKKCRVCITYTTCDTYNRIYMKIGGTLCEIFNSFFNCDAELRSGANLDFNQLHNSIHTNYIIVLCTSELLAAYKHNVGCPTSDTNVQSTHINMLKLVRTQLPFGKVLILVSLHPSHRDLCGNLAASPANHTVNIYNIPEDLNKMVLVFDPGVVNDVGEVQCPNWDTYTHTPMKETLSKDIKALASEIKRMGDDNTSLSNLLVNISNTIQTANPQTTQRVPNQLTIDITQHVTAQLRPMACAVEVLQPMTPNAPPVKMNLQGNANHYHSNTQRGTLYGGANRDTEQNTPHGRPGMYQYTGPTYMTSGFDSVANSNLPTIQPHAREKRFLPQHYSVPFPSNNMSVQPPQKQDRNSTAAPTLQETTDHLQALESVNLGTRPKTNPVGAHQLSIDRDGQEAGSSALYPGSQNHSSSELGDDDGESLAGSASDLARVQRGRAVRENEVLPSNTLRYDNQPRLEGQKAQLAAADRESQSCITVRSEEEFSDYYQLLESDGQQEERQTTIIPAAINTRREDFARQQSNNMSVPQNVQEISNMVNNSAITSVPQTAAATPQRHSADYYQLFATPNDEKGNPNLLHHEYSSANPLSNRHSGQYTDQSEAGAMSSNQSEAATRDHTSRLTLESKSDMSKSDPVSSGSEKLSGDIVKARVVATVET